MKKSLAIIRKMILVAFLFMATTCLTGCNILFRSVKAVVEATSTAAEVLITGDVKRGQPSNNQNNSAASAPQYQSSSYYNQQVPSKPSQHYEAPRAKVSRIKKSIDSRIAEARVMCGELEMEKKHLQSKLKKKLSAKEKKNVKDDIQIKTTAIQVFNMSIKKLSSRRLTLAEAESVSNNLDSINRLIDDKFIAEVDRTINDLDDLIRKARERKQLARDQLDGLHDRVKSPTHKNPRKGGYS